MGCNNPSGADNQQERPCSHNWLDEISDDLGNWVAGFVDGEGSFNVPVRQERDRGLPWRVSLCFNVSQIGKEVPSLLRSVFGVGTVRGRGDGVFYYEVTKPVDLNERVLPFFDRFQLRSTKQKDFLIFCEITRLVLAKRHLSAAGIEELLKLRSPMNRGGKRRRSDETILSRLKDWESSEAICRAPSGEG